MKHLKLLILLLSFFTRIGIPANAQEKVAAVKIRVEPNSLLGKHFAKIGVDTLDPIDNKVGPLLLKLTENMKAGVLNPNGTILPTPSMCKAILEEARNGALLRDMEIYLERALQGSQKIDPPTFQSFSKYIFNKNFVNEGHKRVSCTDPKDEAALMAANLRPVDCCAYVFYLNDLSRSALEATKHAIFNCSNVLPEPSKPGSITEHSSAMKTILDKNKQMLNIQHRLNGIYSHEKSSMPSTLTGFPNTCEYLLQGGK